MIWDLDDTLWRGTLAEGDRVELIKGRRELIDNLNHRGIVNAICSKNDFQKAKSKLIEFNMWDLFVFPTISFNPKGQIVKDIISDMQLRAPNVLFIDDNESNLNEVEYYCPDINIINAALADTIISNSYLKGKNDDGLSRLEQYRQLQEKVKARVQSKSNEDFLRSCNIQLTIIPYSDEFFDRAYELVDRTNQLNYTKKRPTKEEFKAFMAEKNVKGYLVKVVDNFGDNGMIGFYALQGDKVEHFVFSCRILGYGIEQWIYAHLNYPQFQAIGELATQLNNTPKQDWIQFSCQEDETKEYEQLPLLTIPREAKLSVYAIGACYLQYNLQTLATAYMDMDFKFSFFGKYIYKYDSVQYLRSCFELKEADKNFLKNVFEPFNY